MDKAEAQHPDLMEDSVSVTHFNLRGSWEALILPLFTKQHRQVTNEPTGTPWTGDGRGRGPRLSDPGCARRGPPGLGVPAGAPTPGFPMELTVLTGPDRPDLTCEEGARPWREA